MQITNGLLHDLNCKDLVSIAERHTGLKHHGNYWAGPCPFCNAGTDRFVIKQRPDGEYRWMCRVCGDGKYNDVIGFVQLIERTDFIKAVEILSGGQVRGMTKEEIEERKRIREHEQAERMVELERLTANYSTKELWGLFVNRMTEEHRAWWRAQGVPDDWQKFWKLGFTPERAFEFENQVHTSPAYTIPKFDYNWKAINMDYRLITFPEGAGKYRPEKDLPPAAFLSRPDKLEVTDEVMIVEGSKKAMVTTIRSEMDIDRVHVFGIPSKNSWAGIEQRVSKCGRVWICLDPDATDWARKLAGRLGPNARVIELPYKIDDGFILYGLTPAILNEAKKYARLFTVKATAK